MAQPIMQPIALQTSTTKPTRNHATISGFSAWMEASDKASLRVRYRTYTLPTNGKSYIQIEILSTERGEASFSASVCGQSEKGLNGWDRIWFSANEPQTLLIELAAPCTAGFWWWYKDYKTSNTWERSQ